MKTSKVLFLILFCGVGVSAAADSFLTAQSFPEPFKNASFGDKMEFESKDYAQYAPEYDKDTGQCIKNCPFPGLNVKTREESIELGLLIDPEELEDEEDGENEEEIIFDEYGRCISGCGEEEISFEDIENGFNQAGSDMADLISGQEPAQIGDFSPNAPAWCKTTGDGGVLLSAKLPLRPPVNMSQWVITSDFYYRCRYSKKYKKTICRLHPALDIGCKTGTAVYATADGVVDMAGWDSGGGGNVISITHANGLRTQYMHLSEIKVQQQQQVKACELIGLSGNTGDSSGPHLDYRVRFGYSNKYVDPLCPCKVTDKQSIKTEENNTVSSCTHSLFNSSKYSFGSGRKRLEWRRANGHCVPPNKLPDER